MIRAILVVGSATIDTNVLPSGTIRKIGGVVTYAGLALRQFGIDAHVVTNAARVDDGVLDPLRGEGITVFRGDSPSTTRFTNHIDGDERWQEMPSAAEPIGAGQFTSLPARYDHIHLGPLHPGDISVEALHAMGHCGPSVSVDIQGFVRRVVDGRVCPGVSMVVRDALHVSDIVKADPDELSALLAVLGMDAAELMREFALRELVVTQGRRGGYVLDRTGAPYPYAAVEVDRIDDPTGAGDVFMADYLAARLKECLSIPVACRKAAEVAARHVGGAFLSKGALSLGEIRKHET